MIRDTIASIVGDVQLAQDLVTSIGSGLTGFAASDEIENLALGRFEQAVASVTLDVDHHPMGQLLKQLIQSESERTHAEVTQCLEFIYSHLVNKFQGDLAEFLSVAICAQIERDWKSEQKLPPHARYVWGEEIRERRRDSAALGETTWHKGADGLFILEELPASGHVSAADLQTMDGPQATHLAILAVIEVKSYALLYQRAARQIEKHLERLQGGLRLGAREWSPDHLDFVWWDRRQDRWIKAPVTEATNPPIMRLLVKPSPRNVRPDLRRRALPRNAFEKTLPYQKQALATASYYMTTWFIGLLGGKVFKEHPNPWPEFTPEEAGLNAVKEALYHILLRDLPRRSARIATRLYNVYGFGYRQAEEHKDMIWSVRGKLMSEWTEPTPTLPVPAEMPLDAVIDCAWSFYRRGHLPEALAYIDAALTLDPSEPDARRLQWLRGMTHYFLGEFDQAAQHLPAPTVARGGDWWARDKLTLAKICVRLGRVEDAVRELEDVSTAQLPDQFLLIAIPVGEAMISARRGQSREAREKLDQALNHSTHIRMDREHRDALGLGEVPYYNPTAVQVAEMDLAIAFASLGDFETAMQVLAHIQNAFPPALLSMERDPELATLRRDAESGPRFQTWLEERKREAGFGSD